jgi:hypothetical protein
MCHNLTVQGPIGTLLDMFRQAQVAAIAKLPVRTFQQLATTMMFQTIHRQVRATIRPTIRSLVMWHSLGVEVEIIGMLRAMYRVVPVVVIAKHLAR